MFKKALYIFLTALTCTLITACVDDIYYPDDPGDGVADVSFDVAFEPLSGTTTHAGSGRGTAGNAIANIEDLALVIYNEDGSLYRIIDRTFMQDYTVKQKDVPGANTDMPSDVDSDKQAETTTARATFTLKNFEVGKYYIYAVANMHLTDTQANREKYASAEALRGVVLEWNSDNIAANNQMFGYVTFGAMGGGSDGFEAPLVTVSRTANQFHAWLKRAASKVTVVFDGSGLKDNIRIYVKSVTIKDIPRTCKLGYDNKIENEDEMIVVGESIFYDSEGAIDGKDNGSNFEQWLPISRGSGKKGAVSEINGEEVVHSEYDKALFFYENKQGDYEGRQQYNKEPDWNNVGWTPEKGEYDYKDNVEFGTYIEVEAYYVSQNQDNVTKGDIKYRFMLGQNITYNYDATRNHHFKVTLGFRGYANQPDWHIVYQETETEVYTVHNYFVSYQYNRKSVFPVRIVGDVESLEFEIVENNWGPSDPNGKDDDEMADAEVNSAWVNEEPFRWNKEVYTNTKGTYFYGLQNPYDTEGNELKNGYDQNLRDLGAPDKVTPIWAGFLALQVPGNKREDIPTNLFHIDVDPNNYGYAKDAAKNLLKNYFYGKGGDKNYSNNLPQNIRRFSVTDLKFDNWVEGKTTQPLSKIISQGTNNACEIVKAPDGSLTVNLPLWTRPKILLGISGFSGNNPYDTYRRKSVVKITAKFKNGKTVIRYMPVYQVRRIVNPKAIWRRYDDVTPFHVRLAYRENARAHQFTELVSEGAWRAYVKTVSPGAGNFITLQGGVSKDAEGAIVGSTDTPIEFNILFNSPCTNKYESRCAIIMVEYHDYTCSHPIFVRQGYNTALQVNAGGAYWSSFSLFKCNETRNLGDGWDGKNYYSAELTAHPMALGTLFKRGNYNGILIANNQKFPANTAPKQTGTFEMTQGNNLKWSEIEGLAYVDSSKKKYSSTDIHTTFAWGRFEVEVMGEKRHYRVPTYNDYLGLISDDCEFGVGVMYGGNATETAMNIDDAYGYEDFDNDGEDNGTGGQTRGMRGIMVYNMNTANQVFFPIGARGMGRRTIQNVASPEVDSRGTLRYGAVANTLTGETNANRPIPFNMPAAPGAIYWMNKVEKDYPAWDMNYFDMNFNAFDYAVSFSPNGDALPIKLVRDEADLK